MAHIGVFYRNGFDPGAYAVALYHAQLEAARDGHGISLHTFSEGSLRPRPSVRRRWTAC